MNANLLVRNGAQELQTHSTSFGDARGVRNADDFVFIIRIPILRLLLLDVLKSRDLSFKLDEFVLEVFRK
jgi:hypothetical protein